MDIGDILSDAEELAVDSAVVDVAGSESGNEDVAGVVVPADDINTSNAGINSGDDTPDPIQLPENMISVFAFLTSHTDQIRNASIIDMNLVGVREGKYIMFKERTDEDAELWMMDDCSSLFLEDFSPDSIKVFGSGAVAKSENMRAYIGKTNCVVAELNDRGTPDKVTIYRKSRNGSPRIEIKERGEEDMSVDQVKVIIHSISSKLFNLIEEMNGLDEIRTAVLEFSQIVTDINYLVKLEEKVLLGTPL